MAGDSGCAYAHPGATARRVSSWTRGRRIVHCATNRLRYPHPACAGARRTVAAGRVSGIFPRRQGSTRVRLERSVHRFLSRNRARNRAYYEEGKHGTSNAPKCSPPRSFVTSCAYRSDKPLPRTCMLVLLLGVTSGMDVAEIARVEVHHMLTRRGTRQVEIALPGRVTKGYRPRCVFLSHPRTIEAFDRYVEWRCSRGHGVSLDRSEYRDLMPRTRLIQTQKGCAFELSVKRRVNFAGEVIEYLAADSPAELHHEPVSSGRSW